jgi:cytochrome P450
MTGTAADRVVLTRYHHVMAAYRNRSLRQALFDEGLVMQDVLINLHGEEHRARRRLENRLFRRDTFEHYERDLFPAIIESTLAPHLRRGRAELVSLGHQLMMNLGALSAGVDRPLGTEEESHRLYELMMVFIEGATIATYLGDRTEVEARVAAALAEFREVFFEPSVARRRRLLAEVDSGRAAEEVLPRDVLTVLLRNVDRLELADDVVLRETAFFLLSGTHTTATSFARTMHRLFGYLADHPDDAALTSDVGFVQRVVHEVLRLEPPSPVRRRRALEATVVGDGTDVPVGAIVDLDLVAANRDPQVFGADADRFDPWRATPADVAPWGTSFGTGMHACIGQDMASGTLAADDAERAAQLFGVVPVAVRAMFAAGARPDPEDPPELDPLSARGYFLRYPVLLG